MQKRTLQGGAVLWTAAAICCGLVVAALPINIGSILLILATLVLLAAFTPLTSFIVLLVLAPLRALMATEPALQLPLDIGQLSLLLLIFVWTAHQIARKQRLLNFVWTPVYIPVMIFAAALGLTAFTALSLGAWVAEWLKWVQVLLMIALALSVGQGQRWEWLLFGLVLAGTANAAVGFYIFLGGSGADHLVIAELTNNRLLSIFGSHFFRAFGTFGQPNPFGAFLGLIAPLAITASLGYMLRTWRVWRKLSKISYKDVFFTLFYTTAALMMVGGLVISWSRGAWLGFGVSMVMLVFALPRRIWYSFALVALIGVISATLWLTGSLPTSIVDRIASATRETFAFNDVRGVDITPENYALVERLAHWQAALNMVRSSPYLGIGAGNYEIAYDRYRLINWDEPLGHAHNYYLNIFAEAGMIGLASYGALWIMIFGLTWRTHRHPDDLGRLIAVGLLASWTYLAVHSLTDNLYVNNVFIHIGLMLGILALLYRQVYTCKKLETH